MLYRSQSDGLTAPRKENMPPGEQQRTRSQSEVNRERSQERGLTERGERREKRLEKSAREGTFFCFYLHVSKKSSTFVV